MSQTASASPRTTALPSLFVSHGAPTFALEPGRMGPCLSQLAAALAKPRAILVLSPHWMSYGYEVMSTPAPATVHDFGGFARELYRLEYPAAGAPGVAEEACAALADAGIAARLNDKQGLDHGAWVPLRYLYPQADVPVLQVSLPATASPRDAWALGRALSVLRQREVLLLGSGGITHNLYDFRLGQAGTLAYASEFTAWIAAAIAAGDLPALLDYRRQAPGAERAHPTDEHLLPLFFAIGAAGDEWQRNQRHDGGIEYGMLSMDAYQFAYPTL